MLGNKKLDTIIKANYHHFNGWIKSINQHSKHLLSDEEINYEELEEITQTVSDILVKISEIFLKYGSFKDHFDNSKMCLHPYGPEIFIYSNKTDTSYRLGIDSKEIYLCTDLRNFGNIKYMKDDFYQKILGLKDLGYFELFGCKPHKSNIFSLLQIYFSNNPSSYASLQIKWNPKYEFDTMISNACIAFQTMYKLNYDLWKIYDLNKKNIKSCN